MNILSVYKASIQAMKQVRKRTNGENDQYRFRISRGGNYKIIKRQGIRLICNIQSQRNLRVFERCFHKKMHQKFA